MPEKMPECFRIGELPKDHIYLQLEEPEITWSNDRINESDIDYLRSTPLLEHAGEMREVLEDIKTKQADGSMFRLPINCEEMLAMNYLLATIGEEERKEK